MRKSSCTYKAEISTLTKRQQQRQMCAEAAVEDRFRRLQNFKLPSEEEIEPLAEYLCRTLLKNHEMFKWIGVERVYNGYGKLDYSGTVLPMSLGDLDELIQEAECEKWGQIWSGPGIGGVNLFHRRFFFLDRLHTGEREDGWEACHVWEFPSFKDEFDKRIGRMMDFHYPEMTGSLAQNKAEQEYYNEHNVQHRGFRGVEYDRRLHIELEFMELFHNYLAAQDWHRFIEPAREAIRSRKELL